MCTHMYSEINPLNTTCLQFSRVLTHALVGKHEFEREQCAVFVNVYGSTTVSLIFTCDSEHIVLGTMGSAQESFLLKCQAQSQHKRLESRLRGNSLSKSKIKLWLSCMISIREHGKMISERRVEK